MPPLEPKIVSERDVQPSTWTVLSAIGGAVWITWTMYSSAEQIWGWIQTKMLEYKNKRQPINGRIARRDALTKLTKVARPYFQLTDRDSQITDLL